MNAVPANAITHVLENIRLPSDAVQAAYLQKDANPNTGTWGMTAIFVLPPEGQFPARVRASPGANCRRTITLFGETPQVWTAAGTDPSRFVGRAGYGGLHKLCDGAGESPSGTAICRSK